MRHALLLLCLVACARSTVPASVPSAPAAGAAEPASVEPVPLEPVSLAEEMAEHFDLAIKAHDALIQGDLDRAAAAASQLRDLERARVPDGWLPFLAEVKEHADRVAQAPALGVATRAMSDLGLACGGCHTAVGGGPVIDGLQPPPDVAGMAMPRHQWAVDQLWMGLVTRSADAWSAGAAVLAADTPAAATADEALGRARQQGAGEALKAVGSEALAASSDEARGALYARALDQCARCHGSR